MLYANHLNVPMFHREPFLRGWKGGGASCVDITAPAWQFSKDDGFHPGCNVGHIMRKRDWNRHKGILK